MLSKLFRGRLRSGSSPERKLAEIESLSSANPEQLSRLRAFSEDEDPTVRLAAIRHIGLRDQLCKMLVRETDPDVRGALLNDLFNQVNTADEREIAALLFRHARDADTRRQLALELPAAGAVAALVAQCDDPSLALDIAGTHRIAAVRLAAAELIDEPGQLQQLAKSARDKSVQQLVRAKQRDLKAAQTASEEAAERVDRLISSSAKLIDSADTVDYAARVQVVQSQFDDLVDRLGDDQRHVIERNIRRCVQRAEQLERDAAVPEADTAPEPIPSTATPVTGAETAQVPSPDPAPDSAPAVLDPQLNAAERATADALLDEIVSACAGLDMQSADALEAALTAAHTRWQGLPTDRLDTDLEIRFTDTVAPIASALACHRLLDAEREAIAAFLQTDISAELEPEAIAAQQDQLADWLARLDWPTSAEQPAALAGLVAHGQALAAEVKRRDEVHQQAARKLDRLIHRLRGHVQRKQLKSALHASRDIDALLPQLGAAAARTAERKLSAPRSALKQLKDWEEFSARPNREALCEKIEALRDEPLAPDAQAEAVKALRQSWRTVGAVPLDEGDPLRERFLGAAEAAFAHCADWHERQQSARAQNLRERERLADELAQFIDTIDWDNPDLDTLNRAMRASRDEWRHYYPVRHSEARACQKRFDSMMDKLSKAIKRGHQRNADAREALISQAEALAEDADLDQAIQRAIALQDAWKQVGPVAAKQQRQQWKRFRKPMDALFARRSARRDSQQAESDARVSAARDALSELRALAADGNQPLSQRARAAEDILEALQPQLDTLPLRDRKAFERDAAKLMQGLQDAQRDAPRQRKLARLHTLAEVAQSCAALEGDHHRGEVVDASALLASLGERLGENTAARALIEQRLEALAAPYDASLTAQQTEFLGDTLIEIEVLADLPTPDAWRAERRACQIEMLEEHAGASDTDADSLYALVERALAAGPLALHDTAALTELEAEPRLAAIVDAAPRWLRRT
ncbi:MAG: DUF349 domain-containing protein [Pseudomonadota bacterium]